MVKVENVTFPIYEFIPSFNDVMNTVKTLKEQVRDICFSKDTLLSFLEKHNIEHCRVEVNGEPIVSGNGEVLANYSDREVWEWVRVDPYNCLEYLYLYLDETGKVDFIAFDVPYDVKDESEKGYEPFIDYISVGSDGLEQSKYYELLREAMKMAYFPKKVVGYEDVTSEVITW